MFKKNNCATFESVWLARKNCGKKKERLNGQHREIRLQFAEQRLHWPDRNKIFWTDESTIQIGGNGKVFVRRPLSRRYDAQFISAKVVSSRFSISIWSCISFMGLGPLYRIQGHLNSSKYVHILEHVMLPYMLKVFNGDNWIFQHDRSPIHTAWLTKAWLQENLQLLNAQEIDWPAKGADTNPIENDWAVLKRKLLFKNLSQDPDELWEQVNEIWVKIH